MERGTFLYISEKSTGFKVIDGVWKSVNFKSGDKYIMRPLKEGDGRFDPSSKVPAYGVLEFNSDETMSMD